MSKPLCKPSREKFEGGPQRGIYATCILCEDIITAINRSERVSLYCPRCEEELRNEHSEDQYEQSPIVDYFFPINPMEETQNVNPAVFENA